MDFVVIHEITIIKIKMKKQYHILNGDVLKNRFPENIPGEIIVIRECLIDGSVEGNDLKDFFATRAKFISDSYEGCSEQDYFKKTVPELLPESSSSSAVITAEPSLVDDTAAPNLSLILASEAVSLACSIHVDVSGS